MADNITVDNGTLTDFPVSTDEGAGGHVQRVKLAYSADGSETHVLADADGLEVQVGKALPAGDAVIGQVKLTDGTSVAAVHNLAANDALSVAIVDGSGTQITSFGGSGGTAADDDADFVAGTTDGTPVMGVYESTPTSVTDGDMGIVGMTQTRAMKVSVAASDLDVAHDAADAGNPVKIGARGVNALPTAVANADRANAIADLFGRILTTHIDPAMQVNKHVLVTTTQTGGVIWDPTAGKKIAITSIVIGTYGTTVGKITLWFAANGTTVYVEDTHQPVLIASFAPSATSSPGLVFTPPVPIYCTTADYELLVTTSDAIDADITVYGYEWA